ncbi:hypothetical protein M3Y94_00957100 [Aphelenchoides besseyi]|nr:hypothetical protein M3Y94_00957100 [Aphelenchoides besseyi]
MPSKKWSSVHDHFHEISDYGLRCNHCYGTITSGNKTSNLKNHLKYRHPQKYAEVNDADRRHKDRGNVIDEEPANRSLVTTPTLQDAVQDEMLIYNPMFTLSGEQSTSTEIAAPMVVENYLQPQVTPSKSFRLNGTNRKRRIEENGAERARNELETERSAYKQKCMDLQIQLLEQKLEFKKSSHRTHEVPVVSR